MLFLVGVQTIYSVDVLGVCLVKVREGHHDRGSYRGKPEQIQAENVKKINVKKNPTQQTV